ncbi:protein MAIN-LIKE 1 [Cajanus cajan]|nr:protein MAIN-LIKE 1 [Cajanus cajan]
MFRAIRYWFLGVERAVLFLERAVLIELNRMSRQIIHAGPIDDSLLRLQPFHISEHIWNGAEDRVLKVRSAKQSELRGGDIPAVVQDLLQRAGFMGMAQISYFPVDNHLISALVERWRPETHTFHMPFGECTITLEDVAILLGLKISGAPITGYASMD